MKLAETVTFGGSGLERAAHLRADTAALSTYRTNAASQAIVFWRGKPLIRRGARDALARLSMSEHIIASRASEAIFLGLENGCAIFAHDLSDWQPSGVDEEALGAFFDPSEQRHPDLPQSDVFAELRANMTRLTPRDAELAASARALYSWHASHRFCAKCGGASEMSMAGWQRGCGACGGQHFPRTDPVVIMLITHENSVLMGRSPGWPEGMYSLLAGFVEPGETLEAAVRREVLEEAGITVGQVDYLASQPWPFPNSLMFGCKGAALDTDITIDPVEIEDAIWVSREEMMLSFAGENPKILPARKGAIAHFILKHWLSDRLE
ncbi:NAD(+) diphosphatase [Planktotalea arctica]|uniref:NAD(+) diphosphatase n=1 Tax=Planktotalea arctica TaxID=1481893 RepID=UPI000A16EE19|nr:NAD(+) diphosphatase [Planktotalea arctica]